MSVETWGLMPKSQVSGQKIEERVAEMIQDHEQDPDAHLDEGEALSSHRASEIIDHRAESIVQDKLIKAFFEPFIIHGSFQSLDAFYYTASYVELSLDGLEVFTAATTNHRAFLEARASSPFSLDYSENPRLDMPVQLSHSTNILSFWGMGDLEGYFDEYFCGFKYSSGTLYARMYSTNVGVDRLLEITGIDCTQYHVYSVAYKAGFGALYYVDNVLVATIEYTDLDGETTTPYYADIKTLTNSNRFMWLWPWQLLYGQWVQ